MVDSGESKMTTKVSMTEYSRLKGIHITTVRDRIERGVISPDAVERDASGKVKLIHVEKADADHAKNHDPQNTFIANSKMIGGKKPKKKSNVVVYPVAKPIETTEIIDGQEVPVTKLPEMDSDMSRYQKAKASSEELKARKLEIEMEELEGRLIDKNEVVKTVSKLTAEIKESFLNIPPKIAPELLACKDIVELEVKLHKEINIVLEKLSRLEQKYV
jgi:hypothetical protein